MSKNVILLDKDGNQLAPATTATQAKYSASVTVKDKIDELNTRIDNLPSGGGTIEPLTVTANGTYTAPSGVDGYNPVNVAVGLPDQELVSYLEFTGANPYYDLVRERDTSGEKYGTINHTENVGIELASSASGLKLMYGLSWNECYKIEIKLGDYSYTGSDTSGRKALFCFDRRAYSNEGAGLCWNLASEQWQAYSGAGWRTADSGYTLDSFKNKKIIVYFGVYIDTSTGDIYKASNGRKFYILDENDNIIVGNYQCNDYENISNIGLGATNSNALMGAIYEYIKVYKLHNLEAEPS